MIAIWDSRTYWAEPGDEKVSFIDLGADADWCETLLNEGKETT